jgi:hypothetical protein
LTDYRSSIAQKLWITAQEAFMRAIVVAASLFAMVLLCSYGAQAAPWCARYNTGLNACNFYIGRAGRGAGLISALIRSSTCCI